MQLCAYILYIFRGWFVYVCHPASCLHQSWFIESACLNAAAAAAAGAIYRTIELCFKFGLKFGSSRNILA